MYDEFSKIAKGSTIERALVKKLSGDLARTQLSIGKSSHRSIGSIGKSFIQD